MVTAFAVCAVVGVLVLIASLLLGDFEIGGVEIGSADAGLPWLSAPALAAAVGTGPRKTGSAPRSALVRMA